MLSRSQLVERLSGVEGWLEPNEAWELYRSAASLSGDNPVAVEIGSWKGRSTIAIALGLCERGGGCLFAVDPHHGSAENPGLDTYAEYMSNLTRTGVSSVVTTLRMFSAEAAATFAIGSIDMLFVDGSHAFADVVQDIRDYVPRLRDGACVAFNDPWNPGVNRALYSQVFLFGGHFSQPKMLENTVFVRYSKSRTWDVKVLRHRWRAWWLVVRNAIKDKHPRVTAAWRDLRRCWRDKE